MVRKRNLFFCFGFFCAILLLYYNLFERFHSTNSFESKSFIPKNGLETKERMQRLIRNALKTTIIQPIVKTVKNESAMGNILMDNRLKEGRDVLNKMVMTEAVKADVVLEGIRPEVKRSIDTTVKKKEKINSVIKEIVDNEDEFDNESNIDKRDDTESAKNLLYTSDDDDDFSLNNNLIDNEPSISEISSTKKRLTSTKKRLTSTKKTITSTKKTISASKIKSSKLKNKDATKNKKLTTTVKMKKLLKATSKKPARFRTTTTKASISSEVESDDKINQWEIKADEYNELDASDNDNESDNLESDVEDDKDIVGVLSKRPLVCQEPNINVDFIPPTISTEIFNMFGSPYPYSTIENSHSNKKTGELEVLFMQIQSILSLHQEDCSKKFLIPEYSIGDQSFGSLLDAYVASFWFALKNGFIFYPIKFGQWSKNWSKIFKPTSSCPFPDIPRASWSVINGFSSVISSASEYSSVIVFRFKTFDVIIPPEISETVSFLTLKDQAMILTAQSTNFLFQLSPEFKLSVMAVRQKYAPPTVQRVDESKCRVSLYIQRIGHTSELSPFSPEIYISRLNSIFERTNACSIFLSSDDPAVVSSLIFSIQRLNMSIWTIPSVCVDKACSTSEDFNMGYLVSIIAAISYHYESAFFIGTLESTGTMNTLIQSLAMVNHGNRIYYEDTTFDSISNPIIRNVKNEAARSDIVIYNMFSEANNYKNTVINEMDDARTTLQHIQQIINNNQINCNGGFLVPDLVDESEGIGQILQVYATAFAYAVQNGYVFYPRNLGNLNWAPEWFSIFRPLSNCNFPSIGRDKWQKLKNSNDIVKHRNKNTVILVPYEIIVAWQKEKIIPKSVKNALAFHSNSVHDKIWKSVCVNYMVRLSDGMGNSVQDIRRRSPPPAADSPSCRISLFIKKGVASLNFKEPDYIEYLSPLLSLYRRSRACSVFVDSYDHVALACTLKFLNDKNITAWSISAGCDECTSQKQILESMSISEYLSYSFASLFYHHESSFFLGSIGSSWDQLIHELAIARSGRLIRYQDLLSGSSIEK